MFSRLSIRTKVAVVMTTLLAIVSLAVFLYFPRRLHRQVVDTVAQKSAAVTRMAAFSIAEPMQNGNRAGVAAALTGVRGNPDLVWLVLADANGRVFASYNELLARDANFAAIPMQPVRVPQNALQEGRVARGGSPDLVGGIGARGEVYQTVALVRHRGRVIGKLYAGTSLDAANADAARSRAAVALVTLLAFVLGTIAVFGLSTVLTRSLRRIAETTEDIASGDLSKRAQVVSDDEVGQLARSFNTMVDQVEEWNRTLEGRVAERTRELAASEERYRLLFERNLAGVYMADENGELIDCNDACARLFGYASRDELLRDGGGIDYVHPHERDSILRRLREEDVVTNEEVELRGRGETSVWALENVQRVERPDGSVVLEGILLDITDRKLAEQEVAFRAYHDELTRLPNRALFLDRLEIAIANARRKQEALAILFLDLDGMKTINDTFGHATGDRVLCSVAERLGEAVRAGDTVARVGGDEFLILLTVRSPEDAEAVAGKILLRLSEPIVLDRDELPLTTSIGVAIYPNDSQDAAALIRDADAAMYRVKEMGGNGVQMTSGATRRSVGRLALEDELRAALERDEFIVYYQPQVQLETRLLSGAEALIRWRRPDGSIVSPAGFMTACEQSGLITSVGEVVLRKACQQMVEWQKVGNAPARMGVNVSARQFFQRDFVGMVERVLGETGLAPMRLELEITETVAMQTSERTLDMLRQFRKLGIAVAVDDFGTGQSSLSYLKRFPVDTVKIDRSFVADILEGDSDEWIITAILMLANHLGLRTVAEGVEVEDQCRFLAGHDCREIQGYLISPPLPPDAFAERFLVRRETERQPRAALL
jgi:diguanylate cyclase (GGDEF)-like protein/PAS domain S-box-containing protein